MPEGDFITRDLAHDQEVYKLKAENKKVLEHERKCNIEIWNLKQDLKNVKGSIAYVESEKYKKAEDRIAELEKKLKEVELPYILNCEHHNLLLEIIVKNVNDLQQSLKWTLSEVLNKDKESDLVIDDSREQGITMDWKRSEELKNKMMNKNNTPKQKE